VGERYGNWAVQNFIHEIMTDYKISSNDLFLMGDLNIDGSWESEDLEEPAKIDVLKRKAKPEWESHFHNPPSFFTKMIHDTWFYETSTIDKGFTNPGGNERIDHILHNPPISHSQILEVQHVTKAYNLLSLKGENFSDHYGINADLNFRSPHCNPRKSRVLSTADIDTEYFPGKIMYSGSMVWYRVDQAGTYSIAVPSSEV
jgi:hypothetical protein